MVLDSEVFSIQPVPGRAGELWASTCGWVYRGSGFGERWERVKTGFEERRTPSLLVLSPERILAGTVAGLHVSIDGGRSFRRTSSPGAGRCSRGARRRSRAAGPRRVSPTG